MLAFVRFFQILWLFVRYRLDLLVPMESSPWPLKCLLLPLRLLPQPKAGRGERLRDFFECLGPVYIKFGQLLSTRPDLLPPDIIAQLDYLQDRVTPFPSNKAIALIERSLGQPISDIFAEFDEKPLGSASVAQVHAARLRSGEAVVVKVIRPNLEATLNKDMALLSLLAAWIEKYVPDGKRLRPREVVADYRLTIFDELNLQREAANASQLRRNFLNSPLLYIPEVYWDYCRSNVMVMERIEGIPVTDLAQLQAQDTNMQRLAERGVEIFFTQVFEHNFFHADMHPGNIFVSRKHPEHPQYMAVDMAIVGSLERSDQYYLARNMLAMFRRDYRLVAELHIQSGWVPANTSISAFESAIRSVCEPIFEKPLAEISFANVLINLFQTARRFNMAVQPQLVLLQKTLLNIEGLGRQLYPQLDLWQTAHPFLERWLKQRFHPKTLFSDLKRSGPEVLEKIPELPHHVLKVVEQLDRAARMTPQLENVIERLNDRRGQLRRRQWQLLAWLAAGGALVVASPSLRASLEQLPPVSGVLAGVALAVWWMTR